MVPADDGGEVEDFTAYEAARREEMGPPPAFKLYDELFRCEPVLRAAALFDLNVRGARDGRLVAYLGFLQDILEPEAWDRFEVLFRDRQRPVSEDTIDQIVAKMIVGYTARPTTESSSSAGPSSTPGRNGKAGSEPTPEVRSG